MRPEPEISVLLSVYNGEAYLGEAIQSVLEQSLQSFEFIVIDDGSTDSSAAVLASVRDDRLRVIRQERVGLTKALQTAAGMAKGRYLARMDADDLSHPLRLATQYRFMEDNPHVHACGTEYEIIDRRGRVLGHSALPHDARAIREKLITSGNCIAHGSAMIRREAFEGVGGYRLEFTAAQDYDLWLRLSERCDLANLPDCLYRWRLVRDGVTTKSHERQLVCATVAKRASQRRAVGHGEDLAQLFVDVENGLGMPKPSDGRHAMSRMLCSMGVRYLNRGHRLLASRRFVESIVQDPRNWRALGLLGATLLPTPVGNLVRSAQRLRSGDDPACYETESKSRLPLKIAILHIDMRFGGVESQLLMLCKALKERGHSVEVLLASREGQLIEELAESATAISLRAGRDRKALPVVALRAAWHVQRVTPDVVMSFHPFLHSSACIAHWASRTNAPLVLCFPGSIRRGRFDPIRRRVWSRADVAVCVSEAVAQQLRGVATLEKATDIVIENAVDVGALHRASCRRGSDPWLEDGEGPVLVTVSRAVRSKRIDLLLRALGCLREALPARLIVLGDGPELMPLRKLARELGVAESVDFRGYVSEPGFIVSRCDAFVFASEVEGLPTVLLEAMACHTPVVAMRSTGGVDGLIDNGKNGLIVPAGDYLAMANAVRRILGDPGLRKRITADAFECVSRDYDIHVQVRRYEDLFRRLRTQGARVRRGAPGSEPLEAQSI